MSKPIKYITIIFLIALLFLIRAFEADLFYDPLIEYFQNNYLYSQMPEINTSKLVLDVFIRFALNSIITLAIIYTIFKTKEHVKFSAYFLLIAFILLMIVFVYLISTDFKNGYLFPFYIRRFLIHPLFLLLLVPAFYYLDFRKIRKH